MSFVSYSPISRGFLGGKVTHPEVFSQSEEFDFRTQIPQFEEENFKHNLSFVEALTAISKKKGCTPAQLSLAWLLAEGDDIIPIPGTSKVEHLKENAEAANIILTQDDLNALENTYQENPQRGLRFPEEMLSLWGAKF